MKLADLHKKGHILPVTLVKKVVTWKGLPSGEDTQPSLETELVDYTGEVFVKRLSYGMVDEVSRAEMLEDEDSKNALLISRAIRLGDRGEEKLSFVEAYNLYPAFGKALLLAIAEVNRTGGHGQSADPKASVQ